MKPLPPGFIPPWQDAPTLCAHLGISENTLDAWVRKGILPPPRPRGGKRLWKWTEVDARLDVGPEGGSSSADPEADRIRHATLKAVANE